MKKMKYRLLQVITLILVLATLITQMAFFLTLMAGDHSGEISQGVDDINAYQALQYKANADCIRLAKVEGFWVDGVTYCKAVFGGSSAIIPYEELEKIT